MNNQIFFSFYDLAHRSVFFDKIVVFFANIFPYIVIFLVVIFLFFHHDVLSFEKNTIKRIILAIRIKWKEISLVFFSGTLAWCVAQILKLLIQAPRPFLKFQNVVSVFDKTGHSFPSGHATFFMALAFSLFFSHKKIGYLFMFFAFLIGLARIIAGVHFPIDILGGFVIGTLTAYFVRFLYGKVSK